MDLSNCPVVLIKLSRAQMFLDDEVGGFIDFNQKNIVIARGGTLGE